MDSAKIKQFFRQNIGYLVVVIISLIYIATGLIAIEDSGKTIIQVIADSAIILILGISINRVFDYQGLMNGDREDEVINVIKNHEKKVIDISSSVDKLDPWCEIKNAEALRTVRIKTLAPSGLKYDDCFDEFGVGKGYKLSKTKPHKSMSEDEKIEYKREKLKLKLYNKALNAKITQLNSRVLTSEGGREKDPNYLGRTKAQYETKSSIIDVASKIIIALIFGYYGVKLIEDFNWITLIWQTFQVASLILMGVVKMYQSYMFVTNEFKDRIKTKTIKLQEFQNYITLNPSFCKNQNVLQNTSTTLVNKE